MASMALHPASSVVAVHRRTIAKAIGAFLLTMAGSTGAFAQSANHGVTLSGRAGAGLFHSNLDLDSRVYGPALTGNEGLTPREVVVTGAIFSKRLGIGAEYSHLGTVQGQLFSNATLTARESERETVLYGTVIIRVVNDHTVGLEVLGGAGLLRHHRDTITASLSSSGITGLVAEDFTHPVLVAGANIPIRVGTDFALAPSFRVWWLQRGDGRGVIANFGSRPFFASSTRLLVGVTASVVF